MQKSRQKTTGIVVNREADAANKNGVVDFFNNAIIN